MVTSHPFLFRTNDLNIGHFELLHENTYGVITVIPSSDNPSAAPNKSALNDSCKCIPESKHRALSVFSEFSYKTWSFKIGQAQVSFRQRSTSASKLRRRKPTTNMAIGRYQHLHKRNCIGMLPLFCSFLAGVCLTVLIGGTRQTCESVGRIYEPENSYFLMLLIVSAPGNVERRNAIRETYLNLRPRMLNESYQEEAIYVPLYDGDTGQLQLESVQKQRELLNAYRRWQEKKIKNIKVINFKVKTLFAIGTYGLSRSERKTIYEEQRVYNDVLELEDLQDSYANLTTKIVQSMSHIDKVYDFKYLMKVDDDSYLKLDLLSEDLLSYYEKLHQVRIHHTNPIELYWGYFKGAATVQQRGQWKETNYKLCDRYLPYALGGGYVLSKNLVTFIATYGSSLNAYKSEDMAVGTWLASFGNIHRRHDVRFDTAWMPRKCQNYHLVLHKRSAHQMKEIYDGQLCSHEEQEQSPQTQQPKEYFYDWYVPPSQCCKVLV